nr:hypothetical protein [Vibrio parahaemolyticus]
MVCGGFGVEVLCGGWSLRASHLNWALVADEEKCT